MEFYPDGSLLSLLQKNENSLKNRDKIEIFRQLSAGLWHLHAEHVIHCDLALR